MPRRKPTRLMLGVFARYRLIASDRVREAPKRLLRWMAKAQHVEVLALVLGYHQPVGDPIEHSASGHAFDRAQRGLLERGRLPDRSVKGCCQRRSERSRTDPHADPGNAYPSAAVKDRTGNPADSVAPR
jgi:hypothetical protein